MVLLEMNHKMYRDCVYIYIYICNQKSENIDFKGLAEVINKLIFNNLHNPPPTKYFDTIINPLYCSIWCWWKTVEVYKIAKMYIENIVYSPLLALSV